MACRAPSARMYCKPSRTANSPWICAVLSCDEGHIELDEVGTATWGVLRLKIQVEPFPQLCVQLFGADPPEVIRLLHGAPSLEYCALYDSCPTEVIHAFVTMDPCLYLHQLGDHRLDGIVAILRKCLIKAQGSPDNTSVCTPSAHHG